VPVLVEDKDVVAERRRMQAPNGVSDVIQIQGLRKVYPASNGLKVRQRYTVQYKYQPCTFVLDCSRLYPLQIQLRCYRCMYDRRQSNFAKC
jgi:predicted GTPase